MDKLQIQQALIEKVDSGLMSQNRIAKLAKINPAYLTSIRKGNFDNHFKGTPIPDPVLRSVASVLGLTTYTYETQLYKMCHITYGSAKHSAQHFIIEAPAGEGKTYAANEFLKKSPTGTYLVTCSGLMTTAGLINEVARVVGVRYKTNKQETVKDIAQRLRILDNPLLIIDEAENLKDRALVMVKDLYDAVHDNCGIVLQGAEGFLRKLTHKASQNVSSDKAVPIPYAQLRSRFKAGSVVLDPTTKEEAMQIAALFGIEKQAAAQLYGASDSLREFVKLCQQQLFKNSLITNPSSATNESAI